MNKNTLRLIVFAAVAVIVVGGFLWYVRLFTAHAPSAPVDSNAGAFEAAPVSQPAATTTATSTPTSTPPVATTSITTAPKPTSGIFGTVTSCSGTVGQGPNGEQLGGGCNPTPSAKITISRVGDPDHRASSSETLVGTYLADTNGNYRAALSPGVYHVCTANNLSCLDARVIAGQFVQSNLLIAFP